MSSRPSFTRFTRRKWVALVAAAPALAQVTSKTPPQGAPAPPVSSATPEERAKKALDDIHATSERLSQIEVPMDVEPAFAFSALRP
jgi:hypothetical protein